MFVLVLGMFLSVALALAVLGMVAIPARREGRDLLTPKGEEVVSQVREKTSEAMDTAREKTSEAMDTAREKTGEAMGTARDKVAEVTASKDD
jgi:cytoskeletal protein RodZ